MATRIAATEVTEAAVLTGEKATVRAAEAAAEAAAESATHRIPHTSTHEAQTAPTYPMSRAPQDAPPQVPAPTLPQTMAPTYPVPVVRTQTTTQPTSTRPETPPRLDDTFWQNVSQDAFHNPVGVPIETFVEERNLQEWTETPGGMVALGEHYANAQEAAVLGRAIGRVMDTDPNDPANAGTRRLLRDTVGFSQGAAQDAGDIAAGLVNVVDLAAQGMSLIVAPEIGVPVAFARTAGRTALRQGVRAVGRGALGGLENPLPAGVGRGNLRVGEPSGAGPSTTAPRPRGSEPRTTQAEPSAPARTTNVEKAQSKVWKELKPFREDIRTNGKSGSKKRYYQWDNTHNDIEVFGKDRQHLGSMDPVTGEMYKPPRPDYEIKL